VLSSITAVNIQQLDLNLLHVLQAVLAERSATRAAKRLHVTQSAVSNALGRLRVALGDPLVVRNARGLSPTPRARELEPRLAAIMQSLQALVSGDERFEAARTTREFTLACADYCSAIIGPALVELLQERAPGATLRFVPLEQLVSTEGLATSVDIHLGMPSKVPSGCSSAALFEDSFVCLLQKQRKPPPKRLSLDAYLAARHVRVSVLGSTVDAIDSALARRRLARKVALTVPHFAVVPMMVERTGYVATLSRRLAEMQARTFDVTWCEPPLSLGKRSTRMIWHQRTDADPGARFLRELVHDAVSAEPGARRR
jgi:DNA-binding transcriptional LysR family regulator